MELRVEFLKNPDDGKVIGISVFAGSDEGSIDFMYCFLEEFPKTLGEFPKKKKSEADIYLKNNKVVIKGPDSSGVIRKAEFVPAPEVLEDLRTSIFAQDRKFLKDKRLVFQSDPLSPRWMTPGFELRMDSI